MTSENGTPSRKPNAPSFIYGDLLFARIQDVSDNLMRKTDALLRASVGISVNEWRVLAAIAATPHATARIVVLETGLDKSWVSRLVRSLQERGFLQTAQDASDGRRKRLALTDQGKTVLETAISAVRSLQSQLLNGFSATEHEALPRLLSRLQREMDNPSNN